MSTAPAPAADPGMGLGGGAGVGGLSVGLASPEGLDAFNKAHALVEGVVGGDYSGEGAYETLCADVGAAKAALIAAQDAGAPAQLFTDEWSQLKDVCTGYVNGLSPDELTALAGAHGFEHPGLVGLNVEPGKNHPLAFWMNPYYGDDSPQKAAIQDKALARWDQLQAGGTGGGYTLASYLAEYADGLVAQEAPAAILTPAELDALKAKAQAAHAALLASPYGSPIAASAKLDFLEAKSEYEKAACTDPDYEKAPIAGQAHFSPPDLQQLYDRIESNYALSPLEVELMGPAAFTSLVGGTESQHAAALSHMESQAGYLGDLMEHAKHVVGPLGPILSNGKKELALGGLSEPGGKEAAADFLKHVEPAHESAKALGANLFAGPIKDAVDSEKDVNGLKNPWVMHKNAATGLRAWAKGQKVGDLRDLAVQVGMEATEAKKLSRAQVQNYLAGQFDSASMQKFQASLAPKPVAVGSAQQNAGSSTAGAPVSSAGPAPASTPAPSAGPIILPAKASFAEKRAAMAQGLQHLASALAVIPERPSQAEVTSLALEPTSAPVSGGAHSKSFFKDEKDRVWMYKPDHSGKGARATAEAVASEVFHRVGLPSVPVYTRTVGGHKGSIQPIVPHTGTLSSSPSSWSQTDVDAMVRYHVASWICGDHDGKQDNVLRTPGGGMVAVDLGQAWKFVGRDKLSVDYHPNSSFGAQPPVYHQAYKAAANKNLAKGVTIRPEAAAPVIASFEAIPDDEFRKIVRPVADAGVKADLPWCAPMSDAAKKRYKTTAPTSEQVADAFVETLVDRKKELRSSFTSFFSQLGLAGASDLEEVA